MIEAKERLKAIENTHICYGHPEDSEFWQRRLPAPVEEMGSQALSHFIKTKVNPKLKPGMMILNKNLNLN